MNVSDRNWILIENLEKGDPDGKLYGEKSIKQRHIFDQNLEIIGEIEVNSTNSSLLDTK